jgi:hypothetical protein
VKITITAIIILLIAVLATCVQPGSGTASDLRGDEYAGSEACVNCHKPVYDSFLHTAHYRTSREASSLTVKGSFDPPGNSFTFRPGMSVAMERRHSGLYQVATVDGKEEEHRFDMVIGSGRKAQTFLYWDGNSAMQLPISYFVTLHSWANSPDFPPDRIWFGRSIPSRCFECHSSYIEKKEPLQKDAFHQVDQFDRARILYGIDCERCHGPAGEHVRYQSEHPKDTVAHAIPRYADLSRQQKLDMCAVCHSGTKEMQRSAFDFRPGDTLSHFYYPVSDINGTAAKMDVHGNQYQLLTASQCFLQTNTLECGSCHGPHEKLRDTMAVFSTRCMNCHKPPGGPAGAAAGAAAISGSANGAGQNGNPRFCKLAHSLGTAMLIKNCIDCHMPLQASRVITLQTQGQLPPTANLVRSHLIAIYPEEAKKFIAAMKPK